MAKTLTEASLTTRNARSGLPKGLHWRSIDRGVHLGYRKGVRGGQWLVRWQDQNKRYVQRPIGPADDILKVGTLSYDAAVKAAREIVEKARIDAAAEAAGPVLTVRAAVEAYIEGRDARDTRRAGRKKRSNASSRLGRYLLGAPAYGKLEATEPASFADTPLHALTEKQLRRWRDALPATLKASTKRRTIGDLRAALNLAYQHDRDRLPSSFARIVKDGLRPPDHEDEPVARDNQIHSDAEIARILKASREIDEEQYWGGDLYRMILVLAATGTRFSQAARLRVRDLQIKERRLLIPPSRKGRGGAKTPAIILPIGDDVVEALAPIIAHRPKDAPLLERWRYTHEPGVLEWRKHRREPWREAELSKPWRAIRERAGLPHAVAYSLRHTSIVRAIRANLPLRLVAAMHDTSTEMIERHYSKWITSGLEEMARAAIVPLVAPDDENKVIELRR